MDATLRDTRRSKKLTQARCAAYLGVPLRTYQLYETDPGRQSSIKYRYMLEKLTRYGFMDEDHGILDAEVIRRVCGEVLSGYDAEYAYLFGSYAKGTATEKSDVDLLVSAPVTGMRFFELTESLREALRKRVDVLSPEQLSENPALLGEILRDGVKIYG